MKSFNDSLTGKYLRIALPAALEGIFMTFLAAADLIMVGVLGAKAIAAVSIFLPLRLVLLTASQLRVMISVRSFRMAMECSK